MHGVLIVDNNTYHFVNLPNLTIMTVMAAQFQFLVSPSNKILRFSVNGCIGILLFSYATGLVFLKTNDQKNNIMQYRSFQGLCTCVW